MVQALEARVHINEAVSELRAKELMARALKRSRAEMETEDEAKRLQTLLQRTTRENQTILLGP